MNVLILFAVLLACACSTTHQRTIEATSAAARGDDATVSRLLTRGITSVVGSGWNGRQYAVYHNPLVEAVRNERYSTAKLLLDGGISPDQGLPLLIAAKSPKLTRLLLEKGADPFRGDAYMKARTPGWAHPEAAKLIVEAARQRRPDLVAADERVEAVPSQRNPAPPASASLIALSALPLPRPLEPSFESVERPQDYAVIIGIENYGELPPAANATRDAVAVKNFVRALGIPERNISLLTEGRATKNWLEKTIEAWLPNNVRPTSRVIVYYSGHGAPDPSTGEAYLVPSDGDPQYLANTGYSLKRLYSKLGTLGAKGVVVLLDSCFSGAGGRSLLARGTRPLVGKTIVAPDSETLPTLTILAASSESQISGIHEAAGHGLFTYHLLAGIDRAAKVPGARITAASLHEYLSPRVQDDAKRANREQTPKLLGSPSSSAVLRE